MQGKNQIELPNNGGTVELVLITPEMAREWLDKFCYRGQRIIKEVTVLKYLREINLGRFDAYSMIGLVRIGGKMFLTDGQHRLQAIMRSGKSVWLVVRTLNLKDEYEVARDYNAADSDSRTQSAHLKATGVQEALGLTATQMNMISAATTIILGGFSPRSNQSLLAGSAEDKAAAIREWAPEFGQYLDDVNIAHSALLRALKLRGVMSVAMVTYRHSPLKASQFWGDVVKEEDRSRSGLYLERRLLYRELPRTNAHAHISRLVAEAWNRFYQSKALPQKFSCLPNSAPIYIAGTPFDGRQSIDLFAGAESPEVKEAD